MNKSSINVATYDTEIYISSLNINADSPGRDLLLYFFDSNNFNITNPCTQLNLQIGYDINETLIEFNEINNKTFCVKSCLTYGKQF